MRLGDEIEYGATVYTIVSIRHTLNQSGHSLEIVAYEPLLASSMKLDTERKASIITKSLEYLKKEETQ